MQVLGQRWVGIACIVALVMAAAPLGDAGHNTGTIHVTNVTPADKGFRISLQTQTLSFDVTNGHATASAEEIEITVPTGNGLVRFTDATVDETGWTAALSDSDQDADADNDKILLTGGLGAAKTVRVNVFLRVLATADTDPGNQATMLDVTVTAIDKIPAAGATPATTVTLGTDTIQDLTFWNSRIQVSPSIVIAAEEGTQQDVSVSLRAAYVPTGAAMVQVAVSVADQSIAQLANAQGDGRILLTFGSDNAPQTVTVVADDIDQVASGPRQTTLRLRYAEMPLAAGASVPIFVTDDDTAAILVTETDDGTIVYEGSDGDEFTVSLATQPTAEVTLSVTVGAPAQATVDKATLKFNGTTWLTPQIVKVSATNDAVAENLVTTSQITVAVAAPGDRDDGYDEAESRVITLSVIDDEGAALIVEQSDQFTLVTEAEGGRSDDFTVVLARQPLHDVFVDIVLPSVSGGDLSVLPARLTFTQSNWLLPQSVIVTAINDTLAEGTEIASIEVKVDATRGGDDQRVSSPEYINAPKQTVQVTIADNDERSFVPVVTSTIKRTSETGTEVTAQVKLSVKPDADVTIHVTSADISEITVKTGAQLVFKPDNFATAQSVVLRGVDDDLRDGHQDVNITFSVSADSHPLWRNLPDVNLTVTNRDNEHTVMARPSMLDVEEGGSKTYEISLTMPPATGDTVKVLVAPEAGLGLASPTAVAQQGNDSRLLLSFSAADAPQTVTVTVLDDDSPLGDRILRVSHTATSADVKYHDIPIDDLTVTVTDDERFDLLSANQALQDTVRVEHRGGDNYVTWDIDVVEGDPIGVQIWRSDSPFAIAATLDNDTPEFRDEEYRDRTGGRAAGYIVTVFYGHTSDQGRFPANTPLSMVPGYLGLSLDQQQALGVSAAADEGISTGALIAIIVAGAVAVVLIIVLVVVAARRSKGPEDEDWETPVEAWQPDSAAPPPAADEPRHHLTCPRCDNDFDAMGHKPLVTRCPHCGVEGTLR